MHKYMIIIVIFVAILAAILLNLPNDNHKKLIAIANYGSHSSLHESIKGIKAALEEESQNEIEFVEMDVAFKQSEISKMIRQLLMKQPEILITLTTPVSQVARKLKKTEQKMIFSTLADPVAAGILDEAHLSSNNITGSSDMQNFELLVEFAKEIKPNLKKIGVMYSPLENNDVVMVKELEKAALKANVKIDKLEIMSALEVQTKMSFFAKSQPDLIFVGTSGPIQPSLPIIAKEAAKYDLPIINATPQAVHDKLATASFGVDFFQVGFEAGLMAKKILSGEKLESLEPQYSGMKSFHSVIDVKKLKSLNLVKPLTFIKNVKFINEVQND